MNLPRTLSLACALSLTTGLAATLVWFLDCDHFTGLVSEPLDADLASASHLTAYAAARRLRMLAWANASLAT